MPFVWDKLVEQLLHMYRDSWAQPHSDMNPRREVALIFSSRVGRRCAALSLLFKHGLYDQAVPLVRAAYEDWLTVGTILAATEPTDQTLANEYREDVAKTEARLYKSFGALAGDKARREAMPDPPENVLQLSFEPASKLRVSGNWAAKADALSLRAVHDYVHPYLSEIAHGNARNQVYLFVRDEQDDGVVSPVLLERDEDTEQSLALWAWWFQWRVLTIAARERGIDFEAYADTFMQELRKQGKHRGLQSACFQRERPKGKRGV